jgi:hypothetical protein
LDQVVRWGFLFVALAAVVQVINYFRQLALTALTISRRVSNRPEPFAPGFCW